MPHRTPISKFNASESFSVKPLVHGLFFLAPVTRFVLCRSFRTAESRLPIESSLARTDPDRHRRNLIHIHVARMAPIDKVVTCAAQLSSRVSNCTVSSSVIPPTCELPDSDELGELSFIISLPILVPSMAPKVYLHVTLYRTQGCAIKQICHPKTDDRFYSNSKNVLDSTGT